MIADNNAMRNEAVEAALAMLRDETSVFSRAKQAVKEEVIKPAYAAPIGAEAISQVLRGGGWDADIKQQVYEKLRHLRRRQRQAMCLVYPGVPAAPLPVPLETSKEKDIIEWARSRWAYLVLARLRELSRQQNQPFLRPRKPPSAEDKEDEEVTAQHIVDMESLYILITKEMKGRAVSAAGGAAGGPRCLSWTALGVQLHVDSFTVLQQRFQDLTMDKEHLGVPDPPADLLEDYGLKPGERFAADLTTRRIAEGKAILTKPYPPDLQEFARFGVPPSLRREIWSRCLLGQESASSLGVLTGSSPVSSASGNGQSSSLGSQGSTLQEVARGVCVWEWLTDDILRLDVAEYGANDVCYFPFDEIMEAMVLALSRDPSVSGNCEGGMPQIPILAGADPGVPSSSATPAGSVATPAAMARASSAASATPMFVPPCGIVPFTGFSCYASPFAFLSERLEVVYPLFRAFYCRYLSRLHTISGEPGSLLHLCALFENLAFTKAPEVCLHLIECGSDAAPLRLVFPWIVRGFVGYLRADQVLWLWDRVIGFGSTEVFAILAAAIFVFRARVLANVKNADEATAALSDISGLQVMPLLLQFLAAPRLLDSG
eukprot:TRINITY_DN25638_c0_g1_i1.p1 TRINITY_DN25638_c0_g1~~TRINITY_DN25638_c0_g1_i1.p1  ORF type:complete len:602 (+),score=129.06 TRINITY_DN25638_c0_g1_i1:183-1988(+)